LPHPYLYEQEEGDGKGAPRGTNTHARTSLMSENPAEMKQDDDVERVTPPVTSGLTGEGDHEGEELADAEAAADGLAPTAAVTEETLALPAAAEAAPEEGEATAALEAAAGSTEEEEDEAGKEGPVKRSRDEEGDGTKTNGLESNGDVIQHKDDSNGDEEAAARPDVPAAAGKKAKIEEQQQGDHGGGADDDPSEPPPIPPSKEGESFFNDNDVLSGRGGGTNVCVIVLGVPVGTPPFFAFFFGLLLECRC
jgi:hypothetical protein